MAATATQSSSAADSYIGCLISLTSKSEIRYEGILFQINPQESSIGLREVRSFGTEGRKKDGPQIPPSDKVYEHILFRGTDIKDLQVKSSPPMQPDQPINNDPAIIQSHYSRPVTASVSFPSAVSGSLPDLSSQSQTSQLGLPGATGFQGALPLYQPGGNFGPWGVSPAPPNPNGVALAMPMYWQGYYSAPNVLPHLHQQSLLTPPPYLAMPSSMEQPMPYLNFRPPFRSGASNLTETSPSVLPTTSSTHYVVSTSLPASTVAPILPPVPLVTRASDILKTSTIKAPNVSLPVAIPSTALPSLASFTTSSTKDVNELIPNKSIPSVVGASQNAFSTVSAAAPLFTSGLPQLRPAILGSSSQSSLTAHKFVEVVSVPSLPEQPMAPTKSQLLTLPFPVPVSLTTSSADINHGIPVVSDKSTPSFVEKTSASTTVSPAFVTAGSRQLASSSSSSQSAQTPKKNMQVGGPNGAPTKTHRANRGHGRGRGLEGARTVMKFTEDFDFMAMNEKFRKEEVWGHLGRNSKSRREKETDRSFSDEDSQNGENTEASKIEPKPVYQKDDFFDTISSTALDDESQNGRIKYSEQLKIDTETFGDFVKYPRGRGGRGPGRGGRSRGCGYHGRGYGFGGRGRGRGRGRSTRVA